MATNGPWFTSDDLISSVKRKISFPISQNTFTEADILAFANEELMIAQVPSILRYHEEYFVVREDVPITPNISKYEIPNRAIGMKLRDIFSVDDQGNLTEMTRVSSDDAAYFQQSNSNDTTITKFFLRGNFVVLTPEIQGAPTGSLSFNYYLRPNTLTSTDQAAICTNFVNTIVVSNTTLLSGDTITITQNPNLPTEIDTVFTAGTDFAIGGTDIITATNLTNAINSEGTFSANNGTVSSTSVVVSYDNVTTTFTTSNTTSFFIQDSVQGVQFNQIPSSIMNSSDVDFLQTQSGHRTKAMDITIPKTGISGLVINFTMGDVPSDFIVGDYICPATLCIIPQIPTDLHSGLAERTAVRILAALGDMSGVQASQAKIDQISTAEDKLLDSRVEGAPKKILNRHSLLHYGKMGFRRVY